MAIATIILAAGGSSRLGQPKQLIQSNGETLVRRMTQQALALRAGPVVVVLGANQDRIMKELTGLAITTVVNPTWAEGMASSLRTGLRALDTESTEAFLVVLTDQPYVTADLLQQLIDTRQSTGRGIIASRYAEPDGILGVPALFDNHYRREFLNLTGDTGARKLIQQYASDSTGIHFPLAGIDLDTPADLRHWQAQQASQ
ncbi:molybdenum cofactor cytidylyltransferase [Spirosoma oryzae]|uniref:Molybdenum cofactor cytidylyltransferase n=1 Tax=Spirosoma oryzae TaxID=1469603 RepID=A0A2T0TIL9_9BACT|nr:nucleotidyltransferase family protein [Spirosoma oryzae]PRY45513.1 molybdenum cofactor cytidylyltransferase [Spirosoma oryzae]